MTEKGAIYTQLSPHRSRSRSSIKTIFKVHPVAQNVSNVYVYLFIFMYCIISKTYFGIPRFLVM